LKRGEAFSNKKEVAEKRTKKMKKTRAVFFLFFLTFIIIIFSFSPFNFYLSRFPISEQAQN